MHKDYQGWHKVARSDPSSRGRSHISYSQLLERQIDGLSDVEDWVGCAVLSSPWVKDFLENVPLSTDYHAPDIGRWFPDPYAAMVPGTRDLAEEMAIKHPVG